MLTVNNSSSIVGSPLTPSEILLMAQTKQMTINVNGHIIKMVVRQKTQVGNLAGYSARISDNKGNEMHIRHIQRIRFSEAQDIAFVKFVKQYC